MCNGAARSEQAWTHRPLPVDPCKATLTPERLDRRISTADCEGIANLSREGEGRLSTGSPGEPDVPAGSGRAKAGVPNRIGATIGRYRILELVGSGSMGVVYRAEDLSLGRVVALKVVAPHLLQDHDVQQRFLREARASAALDHPNVCPIYEVGEDGDSAFIAMAFIEGRTARELLSDGPVPVDLAARIIEGAARGLEAAHSRGIIHRDLKPDNIMVSHDAEHSEPRVYVVDFGVARLADHTDFTAAGSVLGTISYMSPEQVADAAVDVRSDIWSLGVVLYELLTGRKPFARGNPSAILYAIRQDAPESVAAIRADVPIPLQAVVGRALQKEPRRRFKSAKEMARALESITAASHEKQPGTDPPAMSRVWSKVVVAALAGACMIAAVLFLRKGPPEPQAILMPTKLTSSPGAEREPTFSPDGKRIAFFRAAGSGTDGRPGIFVRRLETGEETRLTAVDGRDQGPAWSPDGGRIAFTRSQGDGMHIMVVSASGGEPEEHGHPIIRPADVTWTPDSVSLLFTRPTPDGGVEICKLDLRTDAITVGHRTAATIARGPLSGLLAGRKDPGVRPGGRGGPGDPPDGRSGHPQASDTRGRRFPRAGMDVRREGDHFFPGDPAGAGALAVAGCSVRRVARGAAGRGVAGGCAASDR